MFRRAVLFSVFAAVFLVVGTLVFVHIRGGLLGQTLPTCDPNACAGDGQSVQCSYPGGMGTGQLQCCPGLYEGAGECHSGCTQQSNGNLACECDFKQTCTFPAETNNGISVGFTCPAGYVVHFVDAYETVPNIPFNNSNNCPAAEFNADGSVRHYECPGVCTNPPTVTNQEGKNPATVSYSTYGNCGDPVVGCWKYGYTVIQCVPATDTARNSCQPYCGDGAVNGTEVCDDGYHNGEWGKCNTTCTAVLKCGDGIVQTPYEQCDDGANNGAAGDPCTSFCQTRSSSSSSVVGEYLHCGNGTVEPKLGEQCDDGNKYNGLPGDDCTSDCQLVPICPYQKGVKIDTGAILSYVTQCQQQCSGPSGNQCCPYSIWFGPGDKAQCACMPPAKPHPVSPVATQRNQIQQAYDACMQKVCVDNNMVPAFICSYACTANASDMCSCECIHPNGICNNNGVCEIGETYEGCPGDCGGPTCSPTGLQCPASSSSSSIRSSSSSSAVSSVCNINAVCTSTECGPPPEMANMICPDGKAVSGPKCERDPVTCGCTWVRQACSSVSSVSSSSSFVSSSVASSSSSSASSAQASSASQSSSAATSATVSSKSSVGSTGNLCGNGRVDPGEQCDDGNKVDTDGCTNACTTPYCGDGIVSLSEQCDDGPKNSNDPGSHCRMNCKLARCGDAVIDPNEQCDDGNTVSGDGCSATCTLEHVSLASSSSALSAASGYCCIGGSCFGSADCVLSLPQCRTSCVSGASSSISPDNGCLATACQDGGDDFCGQQGKVCVTDPQLPCMKCMSASQSSSPYCTSDKECAGGLFCIDGVCGSCRTNDQCSTGVCVNGQCVPCTVDADCSTGYQCIQGKCAPVSSSSLSRTSASAASSKRPVAITQTPSSKAPGCVTSNDCSFGAICINGSCNPCSKNEECLTDLCRAGSCVRCISDAACPVGQRCMQGDCVPASASLSTPTYCGNGRIDPGEQCDDGVHNSNQPNANCRPDCTLGRCGDGIVDMPLESCDDGSKNGTPGDSCDANCHPVHPSTEVLPVTAFQLPLMPQSSASSAQFVALSPGNTLCTSDAQCAAGQYCLNGQCMSLACRTSADCAVGMQCINGQCIASVQYGQQAHAPVGKTGPATLAIMAAGASAGYAFVRRKKRG